MLLDPFIEEQKFEFIVNKEGRALLLHKAPLRHNYLWIQYDSYLDTIQFVSEEGAVQEMGVVVSPSIKESLHNTQEITLVEVNESGINARHMDVVFNNVLNKL